MSEKTKAEILQEQINKQKEEISALKTTLTIFNNKFEEMEKVHAPAKVADKQITPSVEQTKPNEPDASAESGEPTAEVILRHLESCPDCYKEVGTKAYGLKKEAVCVDCGTEIYGNPESCPKCHGKNARRA